MAAGARRVDPHPSSLHLGLSKATAFESEENLGGGECQAAGGWLPLEKGVWGAWCCLSKFLFKCGSKKAALLVEKHHFSEGTNLLNTEKRAQRSCEIRSLCSQLALAVEGTSALRLHQDC